MRVGSFTMEEGGSVARLRASRRADAAAPFWGGPDEDALRAALAAAARAGV